MSSFHVVHALPDKYMYVEFLVASSKQAHRVAQRTQIRTGDGTMITAWSQWNPTRDLEQAERKLQQMEQMEEAVAQCSNNQINAAVADASVQAAIQEAAAQLAASTYQDQRGALMAAMQSRVQQAALMQNAKRAATEVGGQEQNPKRGPGAT